MEINTVIVILVLIIFLFMLPATYMMGIKLGARDGMTCCQYKYRKELPLGDKNRFGQPMNTLMCIFN